MMRVNSVDNDGDKYSWQAYVHEHTDPPAVSSATKRPKKAESRD